MLNEIARIKECQRKFSFDAQDIKDLGIELTQEGFISRQDRPLRIRDNIEVKLIQDPTQLLELGKAAQSCIYRPHDPDETQLSVYSKFLNDPAALYFSLESEDCLGYFRLYAGKLLRDRTEVLFEDVLRSQRKPLIDKAALFHPELKAVVALTVDKLNLAEDSYLFVPYDNLRTFRGKELKLKKLGDNSFKKGFPVDFYDGHCDDSGWPRFAKVDYLLNL